MTLLEHYNQSKKDYLEITKIGGESHLSYYKDKYPENYKELKRLKLEEELREAKKTKISSAVDSICRELDALNNCWKHF